MESYSALYQEKRMDADALAAKIQSGQHLFSDNSLACPKTIVDALARRAERGELTDVEMNTVLDVHELACYQPGMVGKLTGISWFCGKSSRQGVNQGFGDVRSGYYRDFPRRVRETMEVDAFCAAVSPMDQHGYFSTSTVASISEAMIEKAQNIYLEVNENLPRALSAPLIHISEVTALCENHVPLVTLPNPVIDEKSERIGNLIAAEIPDGATIQLGIGAIPDAVGLALRDKKDLGIHSELLTDSMIELIQCGAVTNKNKPINRGKTVATFALGSQRIYDYIDNNPAMLLLPADYVNDPEVIATHPNFMSINSALEVDFFGQTAAESIGTYQISGTGGQADYVRGAVQSPGGQSYIAFHAAAKDDTVSRIVPTLTSGAIVTTGKNDIDNIVTEYGIARLRGRTLSQRTKALICVAHPKFREELTFAAKKQNILI